LPSCAIRESCTSLAAGPSCAPGSVQGFRELPELLESSGQSGAPALLSMAGAAAAAELICDTKQEGEQRFMRLDNAKVPHRKSAIRC